jgi:D-alanyl-D-alanine carboxypeptidase (penicillin-binding protein 5/6)
MMKSVVFLSLLALITVVPLSASAEKAPEQICNAALLLDAKTGDVLEANNESTALPPASTVKILVAYVAHEKIKSGEVSLDDNISVSAAASKIGGSQVYLKEGEVFTLKDLLAALLVQSGNDAAYAIAEHIGGSAEGFIELMNDTAKELGMNDSEFHSVHGLPPAKDQQPDLVSARDFGTLARAVVNNHPEILEFTKISELGFRNDTFIMRNHNPLLRTFQGCDGLKTGYYAKAGFSIVTTAKRNDTRLVAVLMGCENRKKRDAEAARLLTKGFSEYKMVELTKANVPVEASVNVQTGKIPSVVPVTADALKVSLRKSQVEEVSKKLELCTGLTAPVQAQTPCGQMAFYLGDKKLGAVPLIVADAVAEQEMLDKVMGYFR